MGGKCQPQACAWLAGFLNQDFPIGNRQISMESSSAFVIFGGSSNRNFDGKWFKLPLNQKAGPWAKKFKIYMHSSKKLTVSPLKTRCWKMIHVHLGQKDGSSEAFWWVWGRVNQLDRGIGRIRGTGEILNHLLLWASSIQCLVFVGQSKHQWMDFLLKKMDKIHYVFCCWFGDLFSEGQLHKDIYIYVYNYLYKDFKNQPILKGDGELYHELPSTTNFGTIL